MEVAQALFDEGAPLFVQIAGRLANEIAAGSLAEGERAPSSYELAALHRINPATAAKGLNMLIDHGLLEKRRGLGMFVAAGARERLLGRRRSEFTQHYVDPMVAEAGRLGIADEELLTLVRVAIQSAGGVHA